LDQYQVVIGEIHGLASGQRCFLFAFWVEQPGASSRKGVLGDLAGAVPLGAVEEKQAIAP
jgi:hypothetical protein